MRHFPAPIFLPEWNFHGTATDAGRSFEQAVRVGLAAAMVSPQFLFQSK
jgi:hypothetical protein